MDLNATVLENLQHVAPELDKMCIRDRHRLTRVQGSGGKRHLGAGGLEIAQRARQLGLLDTPVVYDDQYRAVFDSHANLLDSADNFHEPFSHAERLPCRCSI